MNKCPILYVGAPGTGKTATTIAKYDHCEVLLLSSQTEEDVAGIPYRDGENEKRTIPTYVQRLKNAKGTKCLFLDEIDKARREVADTLLTLITHPEKFGIPEGTDIVAAANPPEWGGGDGLSMPMINRFSIIEFKPNFENWKEYIFGKFGKTRFIEEVIESIELQKIPFLEANGEGLNWRMTSPRSIDMALFACLHQEDRDTIVPGLLTPNAASGILSIYHRCYSEQVDNFVQDIARSIGSKSQRLILRK